MGFQFSAAILPNLFQISSWITVMFGACLEFLLGPRTGVSPSGGGKKKKKGKSSSTGATRQTIEVANKEREGKGGVGPC